MLLTEQKLIAHDGKYIVLPPWKGGEDAINRSLAIPDVYALDTAQQYPIGTKFVDGDRVFHYGYIDAIGGAMGDRAMGGMFNTALYKSVTHDAVAHVVGETEIVIEDVASALNQWAGGYYMPRVHPYSSYRVMSNTAHAGGHSTLTLERGLLVEVPISDPIGFLNQNPYSKLESHLPNSSKSYVSVMGVNLVQAVAARWVWLQTWGPCYIHGGDELLGKTDQEREGFFHIDGSLVCPAEFATWRQRAGHAINMTDGSTSTWFVYLQIAR